MSHFTNVSFSGTYAASGTLFDDGDAWSISGSGLLTGVISHNADGSITGTWRSSASFTAFNSQFGTETDTDTDSGTVSGTVLGATNSIRFTSNSPDSHSSGTATIDSAGTTITFSLTMRIDGFTGSLVGGGLLRAASSLLVGDDGSNVIAGTDGADTIDGKGGDDQLSGGAGDDKILGGAGNDALDGGEGDDKLSGGVGDDSLTGGAGDNLLDGGDGVDTALLAGVLSDYRITLLDGPNTGKLFFTLNGLEPGDIVNLVSKDGRIDRLSGVEKVKFLGDNAEFQVNRDQFLKDAPIYVGTKYIADKGNTGFLQGTIGDDVLDGLEGDDVLNGLAGNDILDGGTGNDAMAGSLGNDTYIVDSVTDTTTELLNQGTADLVKTALATYTLSEHVERLEYTGAGNFSGTGNAQANILKGGAGNDTLDGALGADRMEGGAGNDTYFVNVVANADAGTPGDVVFEGTAIADSGGTDTVNAAVTYTLGVNVENLALIGTANVNGTGNAASNTLTGNAGNNLISGLGGDDTFVASGGNDTFTGGLGSDTLNLASLAFTFAEKGKAGGFKVERPDAATVLITDVDSGQKFTVKGAWGATTGDRGIESFVFSDQAVTLDQLIVNTASAFADTFTSGVGVDLFAGLAGNDTYIIDDASDVVTELLNQGTADLVKTALSTYTLSENVEKLEYTGTGNFSGTGNGQANILKGGAGNDTLDGGLGADRMEGGGGNDTYFVDLPADVVFEGTLLADSGGISDTVNSSATYTLTVNVEILVLTGTLNLSGTGNAQANTLIGNDGNNVLSGLGENDTLNGGLGNDRLTGGAGADQFDFTTALNAAGNMDTITDFQVGADKIRLEADIFTGVAADALGFHAGAGLTQATAAGDRIIYNSTTGALFYDADGAGGTSAVQFAILSTHPTLFASDFSII